MPIVVSCRPGKHRPVAASELLKATFAEVERWDFAPPLHISIELFSAGRHCRDRSFERQVCPGIPQSIASALAAQRLGNWHGA